MSKPVLLQVNNSGAWKTVAKWDATDDAASTKAHDAVDLLGQINDTYTWRIATGDGDQLVLKRWDSKKGWSVEK